MLLFFSNQLWMYNCEKFVKKIRNWIGFHNISLIKVFEKVNPKEKKSQLVSTKEVKAFI